MRDQLLQKLAQLLGCFFVLSAARQVQELARVFRVIKHHVFGIAGGEGRFGTTGWIRDAVGPIGSSDRAADAGVIGLAELN
jgi:hypothetical protein